MKTIRVLITGAGGTTGQSIMKSVRMSELPCHIIATDISPDSAGLYRSDQSYLMPHCHHENYIAETIRLLNQEAVDILLIGSTPEVAVLAKHAKEIEQQTSCKVVVSSDWLADTLSDKYLTCKLLEQNGAHFPRYAENSTPEEIGKLIDNVGFPLLIKPRRGMGSRGMSIAKSYEELNIAIQNAQQPIVIQEYLLPDDQEYTCGLFFDCFGDYKGCIILKRSMRAGETYRAEIGEFNDIRHDIQKISESFAGQARGGINVQLRKTENGVKVFEINPRFSSSTAIMSNYGFNAPDAAIRSFLFGEKIPMLEHGTGFAFRYTNEIFVSNEAFSQLEKTRHLETPSSHCETHF